MIFSSILSFGNQKHTMTRAVEIAKKNFIKACDNYLLARIRNKEDPILLASQEAVIEKACCFTSFVGYDAVYDIVKTNIWLERIITSSAFRLI
jgi:hypothetical protein